MAEMSPETIQGMQNFFAGPSRIGILAVDSAVFEVISKDLAGSSSSANRSD
jgi:hypothetical protein